VTSEDVRFITLTRRPLLESELPTNVTVLNENDIHNSGGVNVADVLELVPGLDLSRSGSIGQFTSFRLRGVPRSNQSQVLIDEQPLGGVSIQEINLALIPADQIERIEVVRGGSSVLYGPNAIGGIVHIFTKQQPKPFASLGYERQSFETGITRAGAGGTWGPWSLRANGQHYETNGYMQNSDGHSDTGEGTLGYRWGNGAHLQASTSFTDHEFGTPNGTPIPFDEWDGDRERTANSLTQQIDNEMFRNRLAFGSPLGSAARIDATLYHQYETFRFFNNPPQPFISDSWFHNLVTGGDTHVTTGFGTVIGASLERDYREASQQEDQHIYDEGLYAEQELNLNRLTLLPALRFDHHSVFGNEFQPRLTSVYRANERWKLSASAARAFRAPTLVDLYIVSQDPSFPAFDFFGNPNLQPEHAWSYDLGTQFVPIDWAEIGVSGFFTSITDRISAVDTDGNGNIDTSRNLGRAEISGGEFEVKARTGAFSHRGSYTYQRAVGTSTNGDGFVELRLTPHHIASYRLTWTPMDKLDIANTLVYVGPQYQNDNRAPVTLFDPVTFAAHSDKGKIAPYAVWNIRAEKGFRWGSVYGGVNNVLDRLYAESVTFGIPTPQPTRTYIAGATVRFGE
jgi:vitamin B12 transporter